MKWAGAAALAPLSDSVLTSPPCVSARVVMLMLISRRAKHFRSTVDMGPLER